jgi:renalase
MMDTRPEAVRVAVIGAGIAGLTCARELTRGVRFVVELFEKSRGVGGRSATRRHEGSLQFDHGAQYFTARDARFQSEVAAWLNQGIAGEWTGPIVSLQEGTATSGKGDTIRYVGIPGMSSIARFLANDLVVHRETRIERLESMDRCWMLRDAGDRQFGPFDLVVSTAPPLQTIDLFRGHPTRIAELIREVEMLPCWAILVQFDGRLPVEWNGAFVQQSPLAWIARDSSKPSRPASPETWVLHASPAWSHKYLESSPDQVTSRLLDAMRQALGSQVPLPEVAFATAHRWRYAIPDEPLSAPFLHDEPLGLAVAGDWCGGPKVEGAFLSGWELAHKLL